MRSRKSKFIIRSRKRYVPLILIIQFSMTPRFSTLWSPIWKKLSVRDQNQVQLGLGNLCVKVNTRSWYWNRPRLVNSLLDRDVWIVSLDSKLVPWCYSVTKQHPLLLKQVLTREFSFVKLNWTCVTRFHLELSCGTHSSIFRGLIFWTDIRYVHRSYI